MWWKAWCIICDKFAVLHTLFWLFVDFFFNTLFWVELSLHVNWNVKCEESKKSVFLLIELQASSFEDTLKHRSSHSSYHKNAEISDINNKLWYFFYQGSLSDHTHTHTISFADICFYCDNSFHLIIWSSSYLCFCGSIQHQTCFAILLQFVL
jgi:hypothetical protein